MISELPRFALHAFELGFYHPRTGDFLKLKAHWPNDLLPLIDHFGFPKFEQSVLVERFAKRPDDDYPWPKLRPETPAATSEDADDE
jgi:hypothetical protein